MPYIKRQTNLNDEVLAQVRAVLANRSDQSAIVRQKVRTLQWRSHQELFQKTPSQAEVMVRKAKAYLNESLSRCFRIGIREIDSGLVDERAVDRVGQPNQNLGEDKRRSRSNDLRFLRLICSNVRLYA